ncbi:MAG: hypothetical protein K9W45_05250 [Candidatus Heimdallarchaeum aukensis]|uniref:Uncharacterized protein n=1 Tax=Candidatus Heimdallarchaeum aukensis TaxID=2876573 RepID=A0A9Y1BN50_9ARCH|nr:MAG: hypothetical protein K9W45_05250 [Candidatus Heimdallarchaeum aukensis]
MYLSFFYSQQKTRPFTKFVEIELERDELYKAFTELDEPEEISKKWIVFAEDCSKHLASINSLASMAFERLSEAYSVDEDEDESVLPLHRLLYGSIANQMLSLTQFQLKLGVLIYIYSQVRNRGVFSYAPEDYQYYYYIQAKETLDDVLYRIMEKKLPEPAEEGFTPTPTVNDMMNIMFPLLKLEQRKRLIPILKQIPDHDKNPLIIKKIGDYDRLQGITLMSNIIEIMENSAVDFWWKDPISTLSILDHALEHFNLVVELWKEQPGELTALASRIEQDYIPIVYGSRFITQSQHFVSLAESALESFDIDYASKYYDQAMKKLEEAKEYLFKSNNILANQLYETIKNQEQEVQIISTLTKLSNLFSLIMNDLVIENKEKAIELCDKINQLIKLLESSIPIPYLYGISVSYAAAASALVKVVEQDVSYLNIIDRFMSQFSFPLNSMKEAIANINLNSIRINDNNPRLSYSFLREIEENLKYLKKAVEMLPKFLNEKVLQQKKISAILYYVRSYIAENKIYIYADNNIVLDLILRARAHYFAKKAEQQIADTDEKELLSLIKNRILETKSSGIVTETNLLSLGLQTAYSKTVRDVIEQILLFYDQIEKPPEFILESVKNQFESMTEFKELLNLMELDNKELLALRQEITLKGHEINWVFVERRESFIPATKKMFTTIESVLLGELAADMGKRDDAINYYTKAKKNLYEISDILSKVAKYIEDNKELPSLIYTLALFTQENLNAIRDRRKRNEVPYKEIVGILDYLILNL